jgi:hypothetical protein
MSDSESDAEGGIKLLSASPSLKNVQGTLKKKHDKEGNHKNRRKNTDDNDEDEDFGGHGRTKKHSRGEHFDHAPNDRNSSSSKRRSLTTDDANGNNEKKKKKKKHKNREEKLEGDDKDLLGSSSGNEKESTKKKKRKRSDSENELNITKEGASAEMDNSDDDNAQEPLQKKHKGDPALISDVRPKKHKNKKKEKRHDEEPNGGAEKEKKEQRSAENVEEDGMDVEAKDKEEGHAIEAKDSDTAASKTSAKPQKKTKPQKQRYVVFVGSIAISLFI